VLVVVARMTSLVELERGTAVGCTGGGVGAVPSVTGAQEASSATSNVANRRIAGSLQVVEYVRRVDQSAVAASGPDERFSQWLLDQTSGSTHCSINWIKTPAGAGSPAGMHTHVVDQIFYVLSGTMSLEIEDTQYEAGQGHW